MWIDELRKILEESEPRMREQAAADIDRFARRVGRRVFMRYKDRMAVLIYSGEAKTLTGAWRMARQSRPTR